MTDRCAVRPLSASSAGSRHSVTVVAKGGPAIRGLVTWPFFDEHILSALERGRLPHPANGVCPKALWVYMYQVALSKRHATFQEIGPASSAKPRVAAFELTERRA